jgi:hypothetical protein
MFHTGNVAVHENELEFEKYTTLLTNSSFGSPLLHKSGMVNLNNISREMLPVETDKVAGDVLATKLYNNHGIKLDLHKDQFYQYKQYEMKGSNLFFLGKRYNDKILYNQVSSDPSELADLQFGVEKNDVKTFQVLFGGGAIVCGVVGIASFFSK